MASSSSSIQSCSSPLITTTPKYDVFVSFRGEDTRLTFTAHLFYALQRNGIFAFRDDTELKKGESIAPELLRAIEASHIFIVILSKDYASSTWCLRELEKILECIRVPGKRLLPVFHDVDPSEVRYQRGSYAEPFAKHEEKFKQDSEMVHRWRDALTQVANHSGWDLRNKSESEEIKKIVKEISTILGHDVSCLPNDLVGIHSPLEELEKLLRLGSVNDVRVIGISGMGGIGKTTLATILCGRISHQFDACCFIDDVSKIYRHDGPIGAQKQILHQILGQEHLQICNPYNVASLIRIRLRHIRSLVILDNVDKVEQLQKLSVNRECLGAGSRIIVISRDEHILKTYGVDVVYNVPLLNWTDSLQLFCQKAFKRVNTMSDYERLTNDILYYANGLPLAIEVLGSFLCGRDIPEWRSALARLRESPNKDIMDVLRLSFEGLEEIEKEIFLDIACFFNRHDEEYVKNVLNCCGFHPDIGLGVLIGKSLISISHNGSFSSGMIVMHGLLQELGKKIVQENSAKEPRKWSRLWLREHFYNVMSGNMEKNVEAIVLPHEDPRETEAMMAEDLSKMSRLRLLLMQRRHFSGNLTCLSNELRYVEWDEYPFMYLPSSFQPNKLVELYLSHSSIKQLWEGKKYLPKLRTLGLRHSRNLIKMPDFQEVPNLERLNLEGCAKLEEIDPSIGVLRKLVSLHLKDCKKLKSIPNNIFGLSSLKYLNLSGCSKVFNNPRRLSQSQSTPFFIIRMITLLSQSLCPSANKELAITSCLLPSLPSFSCLCHLDISFCGLSQIPDAIGCMSWLEGLNLGGNNFVTLPSLRELSKLVCLNLQHCTQLESLPELPLPAAIEQVQQNHHHKFSIPEYWRWKLGLYIFNCPKLGEREQCRSMTFSWMIQFIQANQESSAFFDRIGIVIPGSEIPSWFNNQSVGSSIRMDPSPVMHDDDFVGVACCAVFSVEPYHANTTTDEWRPIISLGFESSAEGRFGEDFPVDVGEDFPAVKSDHMLLIYFTRESFFGYLRFIGKSDIQMAAHSWSVEGLHAEIKNCGYRWVFKQDLQLMHRGILSSRKRKFLAIEDKAQPQPQPFI